MNHRDKEPVGVTVAKVIGAVLLVLVALAFGAGGACGVWAAALDIWDTVRRTSPHNEYAGVGLIIGGFSAVIGLSVAGLLIWAAVTLLRKKGRRDE
jgi:hypothetical protein